MTPVRFACFVLLAVSSVMQLLMRWVMLFAPLATSEPGGSPSSQAYDAHLLCVPADVRIAPSPLLPSIFVPEGAFLTFAVSAIALPARPQHNLTAAVCPAAPAHPLQDARRWRVLVTHKRIGKHVLSTSSDPPHGAFRLHSAACQHGALCGAAVAQLNTPCIESADAVRIVS